MLYDAKWYQIAQEILRIKRIMLWLLQGLEKSVKGCVYVCVSRFVYG